MDNEISTDIRKKIFRATFDVEGFPIGFYPDDIWPVGYPDDAIEISEAQWFEFISNPGRRKFFNGTVVEYVPPVPIVRPEDRNLSAEQFYKMLDVGLGKFDQFAAAIESVTPPSKKLTCRNQFNNSTSFSWEMALMTTIAPLVWGSGWQNDVASAWIAAGELP